MTYNVQLNHTLLGKEGKRQAFWQPDKKFWLMFEYKSLFYFPGHRVSYYILGQGYAAAFRWLGTGK